MFWSRALVEAERQFVQQYFGASLDGLLPRIRLYVRRIGDTRRALAMTGGRISMPRFCFEGADPRQSLRLGHPAVAGLFAHELLHQWQSLQGMAVTRQAAWLQVKALCLQQNPYAYARCEAPHTMLQTFICAQVEQQGQMWEDYVRSCVAGQPDPALVQIADFIKAKVDGV